MQLNDAFYPFIQTWGCELCSATRRNEQYFTTQLSSKMEFVLKHREMRSPVMKVPAVTILLDFAQLFLLLWNSKRDYFEPMQQQVQSKEKVHLPTLYSITECKQSKLVLFTLYWEPHTVIKSFRSPSYFLNVWEWILVLTPFYAFSTRTTLWIFVTRSTIMCDKTIMWQESCCVSQTLFSKWGQNHTPGECLGGENWNNTCISLSLNFHSLFCIKITDYAIFNLNFLNPALHEGVDSGSITCSLCD